MKLSLESAELYIPDGVEETAALARTTHLCVAAHQDDIEIMAYDGVIQCFQQEDRWFTGVVVTNGAGSPRSGVYEKYSDAEMVEVRRREQKKAAMVGDYAAQFLLDQPSSAIKDAHNGAPVDDLEAILRACRADVVYTHNLADKHDTHVGVVVAAIQAMRELPRDKRPAKVYGCEIWRNLDWLPDAEKVLMDVSGRENLGAALNGVYDSQIVGGKRYDLATAGRRAANATFFESHATDKTTQLIFGMDLSPLVADESKDIMEYVFGFIDRMKADIRQRLGKRLGV